MTRILSDILQAPEPVFRMQLKQLERVSGHENADIKLSVEVIQSVKQKIHWLGLDKHDTTAKELYQALLARVCADDARLERALRTRAATHISAEADLMEGIQHALNEDASKIASFALKPAAIKRLLKKTPVKRVAKQLGYRSQDAMLRHESPASLVAAATVLESTAWRRSWLESYKQLKTSDFEEKPAAIISPNGVRWHAVTQKMINIHAATAVSLPELGAIVLLPLPSERPKGMVVATIATALHELNTIASLSNYLRASQVQADFAHRVRAAASGAVALESPVLAQATPWQVVQQYFARLKISVDEDVFGPYVQSADFVWHNVEARLAELSPSMEFWSGTQYLSFLQQGKTVSLNVLDAAVNACNQVTYEARAITHAQEALWHELTLRYLNRESLEQTIISTLRPQLAAATVNS